MATLPPVTTKYLPELNEAKDGKPEAYKLINQLKRRLDALPPPGPPVPPPFQYPVQYVSPDGNNANDGSLNFPKKTASAAYVALLAGGDLYVTSNSVWSDGTEGLGLTANQGMRLTGFYSIWSSPPAGWLAGKAFNLRGLGLDFSPQLGPNFTSLSWGQGTDRFNPGIWLAAVDVPVTVSDIFMNSHQPYRLGWDYRRNNDGTIAQAAITGAVRNGTGPTATSTFTVAFPAPWPVTKMGRDGSGIVTARFISPLAPIYNGNWITVANGTTNFHSGNYRATNLPLSSPDPGARDITFFDNVSGQALSSADGVVASTKTFTITELDFTGQAGATITIAGASHSGNNVTANITSVASAHVFTCSGASGLVDETFSSGMHISVQWPAVAFGPVSGPTLGGHMVGPSGGATCDFIEVASTSADWPSIMYQVAGATPTTITVIDPWGLQINALNNLPFGGAGTTGADIGTYVLQERFANSIGLDQWTNCGGQNFFGPRYNAGPCVDRGGTNGFPGIWRGGFLTGTSWDVADSYPLPHAEGMVNPDVKAAYFASGGSAGGATVNIRDLRLSDGGVRMRVNAGLAPPVICDNIIQEVISLGIHGIPGQPCVTLLGGDLIAYVNDCSNADDPAGYNGLQLGDPLTGSIASGQITIINTVIPGSPVQGGGDTYVPAAFGSQDRWGNVQLSLEAQSIFGNWGNDGRVAGKRRDIQGMFGITQNPGGLTNLCPVPNSWTTAGVTITGGQNTDRLDGSGAGYLVTGTGGTASFTVTVPTSAADDRIVFGAWMRNMNAPSSGLNGGELILFAGFGGAGSNESFNLVPPFGGDGGWDWVTYISRVPSGSTGHTALAFTWNVLQPFMVYLPTIYYLPIASVTTNEAYRIMHTFRPLPPYLAAGTAGTNPGQKLIGHGGIGVDATVLATPSGNAAATKNLPLLNAAGTVQGYVPVIPTNSSLPAPGTGTVTSVGNTAPITSSGGTTPVIGVTDFVASGASHARGTVPDPGGTPGTTKFLREDATFAVPPGTITAVGVTAPITSTGGAAPSIGVADFIASGASHARGAVPDPGASAGTTKFLREDATWSLTPTPPTFVASGASHAPGGVPDPGAVAGTSRFLREDATFATPNLLAAIIYYVAAVNPILGGGFLETSSSVSTLSSTDIPYALGIAATTGRLRINVLANSITTSLGTGVITFTVFANGVNIFSTTALTTVAAGSQIDSGLNSALGTTAIADGWSVKITSTGTYVSGSITFTAVLSLGYGT